MEDKTIHYRGTRMVVTLLIKSPRSWILGTRESWDNYENSQRETSRLSTDEDMSWEYVQIFSPSMIKAAIRLCIMLQARIYLPKNSTNGDALIYGQQWIDCNRKVMLHVVILAIPQDASAEFREWNDGDFHIISPLNTSLQNIFMSVWSDTVGGMRVLCGTPAAKDL